jgi:hypothetical protein
MCSHLPYLSTVFDGAFMDTIFSYIPNAILEIDEIILISVLRHVQRVVIRSSESLVPLGNIAKYFHFLFYHPHLVVRLTTIELFLSALYAARDELQRIKFKLFLTMHMMEDTILDTDDIWNSDMLLISLKEHVPQASFNECLRRLSSGYSYERIVPGAGILIYESYIDDRCHPEALTEENRSHISASRDFKYARMSGYMNRLARKIAFRDNNMMRDECTTDWEGGFYRI